MKRDMDLIRLILLSIEEGKERDALLPYPLNERLYHGALAIEAGLIDGQVKRDEFRKPTYVRFHRLTWEGHNFLDAARNDTVWNKAKDAIKEKGGSWAIDGFIELLKLTANNLLQ